jgi:TAG lipase/steryl ester hydrolase/phospholipase A2/LPA acyltransferase
MRKERRKDSETAGTSPGSRRLAELERAMSHAESYEEWLEIAVAHDRRSGADEWRDDDRCEWIHASELRASISRLRRMRKRGETWALVDAFQDTLFRHQGECAQPELYRVARAGTKRVIEEYLAELETCFAYLLDVDEPAVDDAFRLTQVKRIGRVYGRPALLLSGGALLGLFHFGVVKALFDQDLLPRTISGSSMGAIIAAWACVHTDQELRDLFADPSRINREALAPLPVTRIWRQAALLDQDKLRRFLPTVLGDHTFSRAMRTSRRILNITVSPLRKQQIPRLLNYLSAPEVLVNSAVLASCAIPVAFRPVQLMARRRGRVEPWLAKERWIDGSVRSDLPFDALRQMLNINHFITSQTNPHVLPLLSMSPAGPGLAAALVRAGGSTYRHASAQALDILRRHAPGDRLRSQFDKAHGLYSQTYAGTDMHVQLPIRPRLYAKMLTNPSLEEFRDYTRLGERATWPLIPMIRDRTRLSRMFGNAIGVLMNRMKQPAGSRKKRAGERRRSLR